MKKYVLLSSFIFAGLSLNAQALPSFAEVKSRDATSDLVFLSRDGVRIDSIRANDGFRKFAWVKLADIAPLARKILVGTEDQHFFEHAGVDWFSLASNALEYARGNHARGASTLTMQLVSLIDESQAKSGKRSLKKKWDQIESALELEKSWSKDQILEAYLNLVPFRGEIVGIHAASEIIFHKKVDALDPIDASLLVAMLPGPNDAVEKIRSRACVFLKHSFSAEPEQAQTMCRELDARVGFAENAVFGAAAQSADPEAMAVDSRINEAFIYSLYHQMTAAQKLQTPAKTTLDLDLQNSVYHSAREILNLIHGQNVSEIAALVMKNDTGEILAYLGNVPEFSKSAHVDGIQAYRQAGSTLKPFFYERAFSDKKVDLQTTLDDEPELFQTSNGAFRPENYDHEFHGKVSIPVALGSSMNIPAIQIVEKIGEDAAVDTLKRFDFKNLKSAYQYGASIALGTVDVSLTDLVHAYHKLWQQTKTDASARIIAKILADRDSRALTFGLTSILNTPYYTSVKTGTSKDMRDNWCLGFSDRYTVGVWVGNFNGTPMKDVSGVSGAAPLWRKIMDKLNEKHVSQMPAEIAAVVLPEVNLQKDTTKATLVRIIYPGNQAVLAYDPEIPMSRQKVLFRAEGEQRAGTWFLNGKKIASVKEPYFWPVVRGNYNLEIRATDDAVLDHIDFVVK